MIRIVALNELDNVSEAEPQQVEFQIAKEAQETIAESEYLRAITLLSKGEPELAHSLFSGLVNTQVLNQITKEDTKLWNILYNCYKNLAFIHEEKEEFDDALLNYLSAIHVDNTDINTLYRLGQLSLKLRRFELAENAFESCLQQNSKHWAASNGLLAIYRNQNNIVAAYGKALELLKQRQYTKLVEETLSDAIHKYPVFLPFCEKLYGKLPEDVHIALKSRNREDEVEAPVESIKIENVCLEIKKDLPDLKVFMNFRSIGEYLLNIFHHVKQHDPSLCLMLTFEDICDNIKKSVSGNETLLVENGMANDKIDKNELQFFGGLTEIEACNASLKIYDNDGENDFTKSDEEAGKSKPRRRCSDLRLLEQWGWHKNRKSSSRKKSQQERTDVDESLAGFLRKTFFSLIDGTYEDPGVENSMCVSDDLECKTCAKSITPIDFEKNNRSNFEKFFNCCKTTQMDFPSINFCWLKNMAELWSTLWPSEIKNVFLKLYIQHTEFYGLPKWNMLELDDFSEMLNLQTLFLELQYDKCMKTQSLLPNIWIEAFDNLTFLYGCALRKDESFEVFTLRHLNLHFLKYHFNFENEESLNQIDYIMEILNQKTEDYCVHMPNLSLGCLNKKFWIAKRLEIESKDKLKKIPILYKNQQWTELCDNIKEHLVKQTNVFDDPCELDDYKNLNELLLACLWKINELESCLTYAELFLHYLTQNYLQDTSRLWIDSISYTLSYIEAVIMSEGTEIVDNLNANYARLIHNIINILSYQFDEDMGKNLYVEDELKIRRSWLILHRILIREENRQCNSAQSVSEDENMPLSFMLLFTAHENIGKKQTCTNDNGQFLQYIVQTILPNLNAPIYSYLKSHALEYIEQITYCMYGFPQKKGRSRHLEDHNAKPIELTLENAVNIFDFYAPESLPEFNSYKVESITSDMEQFLHKILGLLPKTHDLTAGIRDINSFIGGSSNNSSTNLENHQLPFKIKSIYYLIADFHFKSRDFAKAIKYYTNDLAVNSNRFDSWAGISLSKASIIETKLNGVNITDPSQFILECEEAIRCFGKCISLLQNHILIWIEYGSFAYSISSFCSRYLKRVDANEAHWIRQFREKKEKLLDVSYNCFTVAATLQTSEHTNMESYEEKWLCQYMLGKIAEKRRLSPNVYLNFYLRASNYLYECNATYPIKINHNNPTTLSVEALEVFYRTNAAILKYLQKTLEVPRSTGEFFKGVLKQLSNSPFAFNKAKIDGTSLNAIKKKATDFPETWKNKKLTIEYATPAEENQGTSERISEESQAAGTISNSTNSSSSFSNDDTDSEISDQQMEAAHLSASEIKRICKKAIRNLEECVIRFPEHYKSIYRLVFFFMNGPSKLQNLKISENLLLHHHKTSVGNTISGLFYDRKLNNIFNGVWRIPSSEIDRPGSFSTYLVKCVDILIRLLKRQSNYTFLIDIILQLQKSPDSDKRYIMDSDRIKLYETAIKYAQEIMENILSKNETERNDAELLNLLVDIYKIQKKIYKYAMQRDTWFSKIFIDVYLAYIKNKVDVIPTNVNYTDMAVKLCNQEINYKKNIERQTKALTSNINETSPLTLQMNPQQMQSTEFPINYSVTNAFETETQLFNTMIQDNNLFHQYVQPFLNAPAPTDNNNINNQ